MARDLSLKVRIKLLHSKAVRGLKTFRGATDRVIGSLRTLAFVGTASFAALTAGATALGIKATRAFSDYEQGIINATSLSGLLGDEFEISKKKLFDFGLELSRMSAKTAPEVASAFYSLRSAGLSLNEVFAASRPVIVLAEGTMADMGMTAELVTSTIAAFGLEWSKATDVVNVFAAGISETHLNMERLSIAMPAVSAMARQMSVSLEETVAALGILKSSGLDASMAGTALRNVMMRLSSANTQGMKVLAKYGLTAKDVNIQTHGLTEVMKRLQRANISTADSIRIFEQRAFAAAAILKRSANDILPNLIKKITGTNRAFEMQAQQLSSLAGLWAILKSSLTIVGTQLVAGVSPALKAVTESITGMLNAFAQSGEAKKFGEVIGAFIVTLTNALAPANVEEFINTTLPEWRKEFEEVLDVAGNVAKTFKQEWPSIKGLISEATLTTGDLSDTFQDFALTAVNALDLVTGALEIVASVLNGIAKLVFFVIGGMEVLSKLVLDFSVKGLESIGIGVPTHLKKMQENMQRLVDDMVQVTDDLDVRGDIFGEPGSRQERFNRLRTRLETNFDRRDALPTNRGANVNVRISGTLQIDGLSEETQRQVNQQLIQGFREAAQGMGT